jgi:hypothetical protein
MKISMIKILFSKVFAPRSIRRFKRKIHNSITVCAFLALPMIEICQLVSNNSGR